MTTPDYDTDFYAWTQAQAAALRDGSGAPGPGNLAEEIESLGSASDAIESHLQNLLTHLLKWRYDPATEPRRSWRITIRNARLDIAERAGGSLQDYPAQYLATAYRHAREDAADEHRPAAGDLPRGLPWPVAQVLDEDFWPAA